MAQGHSVHKGAKSASRGNLYTVPCLPNFSALLMCILTGPGGQPFPWTVRTFEVAAPKRLQNPFFTNSQGLQLVTLKTTLGSLSKGAHSSCFHFLLSTQPLDFCRQHIHIKNPESYAEGNRSVCFISS